VNGAAFSIVLLKLCAAAKVSSWCADNVVAYFLRETEMLHCDISARGRILDCKRAASAAGFFHDVE
jgi:hypothetical protein